MAIITNRVKIDLTIKQYGYSGQDAPMKEPSEQELVLTESRELRELSVKEAIRLLVDYLSNW